MAMRFWKPAKLSGVSGASVPPAIIMSASPLRINLIACESLDADSVMATHH
jgi:hypothetical protein